MRHLTGWILVAAVMGLAASGWCWKYRQTLELRNLVFEGREKASDLARLEEENRVLKAAELPLGEQLQLKADYIAAAALRDEIEVLRASDKVSKEARTSAQETSVVRFAPGAIVPATAWRNVAAASPASVLETALWAAAGGDVEAFANVIWLDAAARPAAQGLLQELPENVRREFTTPEQLMAFLSIKEVPLGSASVRNWDIDESGGMPFASAKILLTAADGSVRDVQLGFVKTPSQWKLVMRKEAVAKLAATFKANTSTK
jgi:hypothetical protein